MARTSGIAIATTRPALNPRLMKLIASTMATASNRAFVKPPDRLVNHFRLVGDLFDRDADGKILDDLGHRLFERFAEGEQVAARLHAYREPDGWLFR